MKDHDRGWNGCSGCSMSGQAAALSSHCFILLRERCRSASQECRSVILLAAALQGQAPALTGPGSTMPGHGSSFTGPGSIPGPGGSIVLPLLPPALAKSLQQFCIAGPISIAWPSSSIAWPSSSIAWPGTRARRQHCPPIASSCSGQEFAAVLQQF